MRVNTLSLRNYRNYSALDIDLPPGCTLFIGSNGQGKTNLVETLVYLSSQSSHRSSAQQVLINKNSDQAIIRVKVENNGHLVDLDVEINRDKANRAQINSQVAKLRDFPAHISTVLFSPEQLSFIQGEPSGRRAYVDDLIAHVSPRMASVFSDYDRVVKQRNTLLKSIGSRNIKNVDWSTLEIWDEKFVSLAAQIAQARERLIEYLAAPLQDNYRILAAADHHPTVSISYESIELSTSSFSVAEYETVIKSLLLENRARECERGVTLIGPHRDDLFIGLHELPAKGCASHGETWSLVISLNLASAHVIRDQSQFGDPILILDDVFSALDDDRRQRLAGEVLRYEQAFVTGAVQSDIPAELHTHTLTVHAGTVN